MFGKHGDDHVRIGLVENLHRTRQAIRNIKAFLGNYDKAIEESENKRTATR